MKGSLITFDDLQYRQEIDIIGGTVEVDFDRTIYRGEVDDLFWWPHHLRKINWINSVQWCAPQGTWVPSDKDGTYHVRFKMNSIEFFTGPFEIDTGEILITYRDYTGKITAITLFPRGCIPPDGLCGGQRFELLNQHLKG
ncbi:MAG: hypothetical protein RLY66_250 [Candidatus Parcubacteria bacterium]|jgi:hypothetical protein